MKSAAIFIAAVVAIGGCTSLEVTDRTGQRQNMGQWLESWKDMPTSPAEALEKKRAILGQAPVMTPVSGAAVQANCSSVPEYAIGVDVDTAYSRAMRRFNLVTAEQMQRLVESRGVVVDPSFKHERQPGAFYHVAQGLIYSTPSGQQRLSLMDLTLAKEGQGTVVSLRYCFDPQVAVGPDAHAQVQGYIHDQLAR